MKYIKEINKMRGNQSAYRYIYTTPHRINCTKKKKKTNVNHPMENQLLARCLTLIHNKSRNIDIIMNIKYSKLDGVYSNFVRPAIKKLKSMQ